MSTCEARPSLALVVPCYNEEQALSATADSLRAKLLQLIQEEKVSSGSRIYFVDDGSTDRTWSKIREEVGEAPEFFVGIKLARNYGHQYALYAGLMEAEGDVFVSLDADLQDDIEVIDHMLASYQNGNEVVYGVRENRDSDTAFKRLTAKVHYAALSKMGVETVRDHADFRLMSRRAVSFLSEYREANLYLRGVVPLLGLKSDEVRYRRGARVAGETKYSLGRMISLSIHGMTSFSVVPLRLIAVLGFSVFMVSSILGLWALGATLWGEGTAPGWASTVIPIYLLGGLQLLAIGVAGEYIGKTFMEAKGRPLYQVEQRVGAE